MIETEQSTALGPAVVLEVAGARMTVLMEGAECEALNAMAFPYTPRKGDTLLVIGQGEMHYAIGVLQAQGDMTLTFPGSVKFRAPKGAVSFHSGEAIDLHAPEVKVTAGKWSVVARTLSEKVTDALRWVGNLAQLKAGRRRTLIEGKDYERSQRKIMKAKKDVRVNGERIHLG